MTQLSIIVVNWNTRSLLAQCLASIRQHGGSNSEVLVVDNASSDGSVEMVRSCFPEARLIQNTENVGFARANNAAIRQSTGRYVLLLNSDALVAPNTVETLVRVLELHPRIGACGPRLVNGDGSFQASYADFPTLAAETIQQLGLARVLLGRYYPSHGPQQSTRERMVDWVGGACLLVRRACLDQVGLLDEGFVMYGEELDWCYRMKQHGWQVWYCPAASVVHFGGRSAERVRVWKHVQVQKGKTRFFRKHHTRAATVTLIALIRAANLAKAIALFARSILWSGVRRTGRDDKWRNHFAACWAQL